MSTVFWVTILILAVMVTCDEPGFLYNYHMIIILFYKTVLALIGFFLLTILLVSLKLVLN